MDWPRKRDSVEAGETGGLRCYNESSKLITNPMILSLEDIAQKALGRKSDLVQDQKSQGLRMRY
ncbi:hypothetical protein N7470_005387 [Penicillium chermesinum]|nr:hypothetical protein N7470_005387 [Penicillium chermesinum]